jgi:hypothetical protein
MSTEGQKPSGIWDSLVSTIGKLGMKSLSTGNFVWFILLILGAIALWKLNSADLKEVLLKAFASYGWLGYPLAVIVTYVNVHVLRWREKFYQQEMTRISELRNQLLQSKLDLPLVSSTRKDPSA